MDSAIVLTRNPPFNRTLSRSMVWELSYTVLVPGSGYPTTRNDKYSMRLTMSRSLTYGDLIEEKAAVRYYSHIR